MSEFFLYQSKVFLNPSTGDVAGSYPNNLFAFETSARLCFISPFLSGPCTGFIFLQEISLNISNSSFKVVCSPFAILYTWFSALGYL
jgi:hypothetical protein